MICKAKTKITLISNHYSPPWSRDPKLVPILHGVSEAFDSYICIDAFLRQGKNLCRRV